MRQQNTYLRYFVWFLALLPLWVVSTANGLESETVTWNWAWDEDTNELYAYSENGEVATLFSETTLISYTFWRISESASVGMIKVGDETSLYFFDGSTAVPFTETDRTENIPRYLDPEIDLYPIAFSDPYMILVALIYGESNTYRIAILLDTSTQEASLLSESIDYPVFRFSADNSVLRYAQSQEQRDDNKTIELRERSLATGKETILTELSGGISDADTFGNRWLISALDAAGERQYRKYDITTAMEEVIYTRDPNEYYDSYEFSGDDLIWHTPLCSTNCYLYLQTSADEIIRYALEDIPQGQSISSILFRTQDDVLTIVGLYGVWHLFPDEPADYIGKYYFVPHLPSVISPDGRYILVADQTEYPPNERMMVNVETQQVILNIPDETENPLSMSYDQEGFVVNTLEKGPRWLFLYTTQEFTELPDIGVGEYFDILPDGSVLYRTYTSVSGITYTSIYHFNTVTKQSTLLIEGINMIFIYDIRPLATSHYR